MVSYSLLDPLLLLCLWTRVAIIYSEKLHKGSNNIFHLALAMLSGYMMFENAYDITLPIINSLIFFVSFNLLYDSAIEMIKKER